MMPLYTEFQFDVVPMPVAAFIGERVEYHCVAPCAGIFWFINDTIAGADHNIAVSTWTRTRSDNEPGEESTLWIIASVYANNSAIKCCVEDRSVGFETHSAPAYLTVQGILLQCTKPELNVHLFKLECKYSHATKLKVVTVKSLFLQRHRGYTNDTIVILSVRSF